MINNEYFFGLVYDYIIKNPIDQGMNNLKALTGYASGSFVQQVLIENENIGIDLIIGMAKESGISSADHHTYCRLTNEFPDRFSCSYFIGVGGVHAKMYCWFQDKVPLMGIIGSPNFSWQGMVGYQEVASAVNPNSLLTDIEYIKRSSENVKNPGLENYINFFTPSRRTINQVASAHGATIPLESIESITLSLLQADGEIHERSGLNWGQREGREPNQAYIPVPANIHRKFPDFFPPLGRRFTITTDDGRSFICVIAQQYKKAIECPDNNSLLGMYFRDRISVPLGSFVKREDLERYGRTNITLEKLDNETFNMDFSV